MRPARLLARPLSWFLAGLRAREAKALEVLRLSVSGSKTGRSATAPLEDHDDLLWTRR